MCSRYSFGRQEALPTHDNRFLMFVTSILRRSSQWVLRFNSGMQDSILAHLLSPQWLSPGVTLFPLSRNISSITTWEGKVRESREATEHLQYTAVHPTHRKQPPGSDSTALPSVG